MKKIVIAIILSSLSLWAMGNNSIESLNTFFNAKVFSLSGAGTASVNDVNAALLNSSQLINIKNLELNINANQSFVDTHNVSFSLAYPMPFSVFAFSLIYFNYGAVEFRTGDTQNADSLFNPSDLMFLASFADKLFKIVTIGIDFHYILETLSPDSQSSSIAFNINSHFDGILFKNFNIGFVAKNIGLGPKYGNTYNSLPVSIQIGFAYTIKLQTPVAGLYDIQINIDPQYIRREESFVHTGLELNWYHLPADINMALRLGATYPDTSNLLNSLRAGIGLNYQKFFLDYGIGYNLDLGMEHKLSFSFKWNSPPKHRYIQVMTTKKIKKTMDKFNQEEKKFKTQNQSIESNQTESKPNSTTTTNSDMDFDFEEK